jgi:hypothetical protein
MTDRAQMADERFIQSQLDDLKKAQTALEYAVTFAHRWPQEEFKQLVFALALRVREAAQAVAAACLPRD